ncbi:MAG: hypothetical protein AAFX03_13640 [Pseudomonadota bacterium]
MRIAYVAAAAALSACATAAPAGLSESDMQALSALNKAYTDGWLLEGVEAQQAAVMPLFTKDATIMPGRGTPPRTGEADIIAFWFPDGVPATSVSHFDHGAGDISGDGDTAAISGWYTLDFEFLGDAYAQEGNYMMVAERQTDGAWLIDRIIWNDRDVEEDDE